MTAHAKSTHFYTDCKVSERDGSLFLSGSFRVRADVEPSPEELDQLVELADQIGQFLKKNIATTAIEHADQRTARLAQEVASHLHRHGSRPFTLITPYGRLRPRRVRLLDSQTRKTFIPSAKLWQTSQNRHIVSSLARSACAHAQDVSFRKSKTKISVAARVDSLLAHSTVWNLKQDEERRLETMQHQFVADVLKEHGEMLDRNGFLPPPSKNDSADEIFEEDLHEEIEEQAKMLARQYMSQTREITHENNTTHNDDDSAKESKSRCHVPANVILLQADEVVTKSQEPGRKSNKTYTATLENDSRHCEYLAARSSEALQLLVACVLMCWGLFSGKKLEVISDGASWIGVWIGRLCGVDVYHLLCWYHLCKRVRVASSGLGFPKEEREKWEREITGKLWKGDVTGAVGILKGLLPRCRVRSRVEELIDYLLRKQSWIGDYEGRHEAGLWIASTRVEKWNDTAASERCKHRGMSWAETGVLAMALHASEKKRNSAQIHQIDAPDHTTL